MSGGQSGTQQHHESPERCRPASAWGRASNKRRRPSDPGDPGRSVRVTFALLLPLFPIPIPYARITVQSYNIDAPGIDGHGRRRRIDRLGRSGEFPRTPVSAIPPSVLEAIVHVPYPDIVVAG